MTLNQYGDACFIDVVKEARGWVGGRTGGVRRGRGKRKCRGRGRGRVKTVVDSFTRSNLIQVILFRTFTNFQRES